MMLAEYTRRRDFVVQRLNGIPGVECTSPGGAFYAYPNISSSYARGIKDSLETYVPGADTIIGYAQPKYIFGFSNTFSYKRWSLNFLFRGSVGNDIFSKTAVTDARTLADYRQAASRVYGADAEQFLKLFPAKNDAEAAAQAQQVARISGFGIVARDWAKDAAAKAKSPIWLAQYNHPHPFPPGVVITDMDVKAVGAYHNSDLPFWYGTLDSLNLFRHTRDWTPYDYKLSNQMQDVVVAFAKTGSPVTAEAKIPRYDPKREQRLVFGDTGLTVESLNPKQVDFIENHPQRRN